MRLIKIKSLLLCVAILSPAAWAQGARAIPDRSMEDAEERELRVYFDDHVLALQAAGTPTVVSFFGMAHPEVIPAGRDRDGLLRFLVPPSHAGRIDEYRSTLAALGGTVGKTLPSPRIQALNKARMEAARQGQPDVLGLIVKYRSLEKRLQSADARPLPMAELARMESITGKAFRSSRAMSGEAFVARFATPSDLREGGLAAQRLAMDPGIERVDLDTRAEITLAPNDEFFSLQWNMAATTAGIRAPQAWDITTGSSSGVVGIVDTGILPHPDLAGRILPGYDMISTAAVANDGDGRDGDPTDSGTFGAAGVCDSAAHGSSWHGTHVAGIIAANGNNASGVAGVDWRTRILPVRALGRCESAAATSDIIDGMSWAAGLTVPGVPANQNPARVINASLRGPGECTAYGTALFNLMRRGALLVAAAGNDNLNALDFIPASCALALTVSAVGPTGDKAPYSNYHAALEITAPGGDLSTRSADGILSTLASGQQGSPGTYNYTYYQGTSMAAPHAAGVASLMLAVAPTLTVGQMRDIIQKTARPYPAGSRCATRGDCGHGLLDAAAAVTRARSLNGVRANYSALWFRPAESGWGINLQQQGNIVFGTWFSYGTDARPLWFVMPAMQRVSDDIFSGDIYVLTGVPYNQISGQQARRTLDAVGTATVFFYQSDQAFLEIQANGTTVTRKQIFPQQFALPSRTCDFTTGSRVSSTNYTDLWWNPSESGWGINLDHQGDTIFATWFTYGSDGSPLWLVADDARRNANGTYTGTLYQTTGKRPQDISDTVAALTINPVGSVTFSFASGERGTFSYTAFGTSGSKAIERQVWSTPVSSCR